MVVMVVVVVVVGVVVDVAVVVVVVPHVHFQALQTHGRSASTSAMHVSHIRECDCRFVHPHWLLDVRAPALWPPELSLGGVQRNSFQSHPPATVSG